MGYDEDFDEQYGSRGADVRKFSKQFTTSEQGITEYDEELNELKALSRASGEKRGKKMSITPSVAAIVEELADEEKEEVTEQESIVVENATVSMATAAEQLLRNSLHSDENKMFAETRVYTREIATEQTIGSYIRDNSAQTTQTEIYPIKDLIKIATSLKKAEADLKGKQDVVNTWIRSTYNASVAKSAHSIYSRTNATLNRMEKYYKESVANIRRASRQECENLVAKLRDEYIVYYEEELKKRLSQTTKAIDYAGIGGDGQTQEQMAALVLENEQLRKQLEFNSTPQVIVDTSAADKANAQNNELKGEMAKMQKELESAQVQLTMIQQEKEKLEKYQKKLEATIKAEQEQNKKLQAQVRELETKLRDQAETHKKEMRKLELKYENELAEMKSMYEHQLKQQRNDYETQIKELKEKALAKINQLEDELNRAESKVAKLGAQLGKMSDSMQRANAEREKAMQRANQVENSAKTQPDSQPGGGGDVIELEKELTKARAELDRANRNWERRFAVLRASLHEIKDEAYIRKRIEVLPMSLHTAKVEYRNKSKNSNNPNFPIRDGRINKARKQQPQQRLPSLEMQRELHAFSPTGSDTFLDEDESDDGGGDEQDGINVQYIVAPQQS